MTGVLISVLSFIVAIGILVAVHEFGHFWVARRLGFKVLRFSIGFGRPLWTRVSGPDKTEFVLAAIPLGGYVKMLDEREGPVDEADLPRSFTRRPAGHRIAVMLAGPAANFLFAIAAFWVLFMMGVPGLKPVVGEIKLDTPAAQAGLRSEDLILAVQGELTPTREAAVLGMLDALIDEGRIDLNVQGVSGDSRAISLVVPEGERRALTEPGALMRGLGFAFWSPKRPVVVGTVAEGSAAAAAGLQPGDRIVAVDGERVDDFLRFYTLVRAQPGARLVLDVVRGDSSKRIEVLVRAEQEEGKTIGRVGITPGGSAAFPEWMQAVERHGPIGALAPAVAETWSKTALTVKFLARMVTGSVSTQNISGPINIAQYAGISAVEGPQYFLSFLALVSLSLAVLNLLPIPVLDGGQVVYQLAELVKGRPLSDAAQLFGQKLGIALLVALMGFAFYNDISRLIG
ncbi:MAG: RIP metalloprotease RseP [Gammaproteobacteria bacterium]|nr:RIP metalloprotease RseP [Gammaproteobacteria bacterium]